MYEQGQEGLDTDYLRKQLTAFAENKGANEAFRPKGGNRVHGLFDDAGAFGAVRRRKCGRNLKLPSCGRWIIAPTIITPCPADIPLSGGAYGVRSLSPLKGEMSAVLTERFTPTIITQQFPQV